MLQPPAITVNHPSLERRFADLRQAANAGDATAVAQLQAMPEFMPVPLNMETPAGLHMPGQPGHPHHVYGTSPDQARLRSASLSGQGGLVGVPQLSPGMMPQTSPTLGAMGPPPPRRGSSASANHYHHQMNAPYARPVSPTMMSSTSPVLSPQVSPGLSASKPAGKTSLSRYKPLEKKYICDFPGCGKAFDRPFNLKTHQRTHTGERPFACDRCDKAFSRAHDLKRHMMAIHDNNKPFRCLRCDHRFCRADALQRHVRSDPACDSWYRQNGLDPAAQQGSPTMMPMANPLQLSPVMQPDYFAGTATGAAVSMAQSMGMPTSPAHASSPYMQGVPVSAEMYTSAVASSSPYLATGGPTSPLMASGPASSMAYISPSLPSTLPAQIPAGSASPGVTDAFAMLSIPSPSMTGGNVGASPQLPFQPAVSQPAQRQAAPQHYQSVSQAIQGYARQAPQQPVDAQQQQQQPSAQAAQQQQQGEADMDFRALEDFESFSLDRPTNSGATTSEIGSPSMVAPAAPLNLQDEATPIRPITVADVRAGKQTLERLYSEARSAGYTSTPSLDRAMGLGLEAERPQIGRDTLERQLRSANPLGPDGNPTAAAAAVAAAEVVAEARARGVAPSAQGNSSPVSSAASIVDSSGAAGMLPQQPNGPAPTSPSDIAMPGGARHLGRSALMSQDTLERMLNKGGGDAMAVDTPNGTLERMGGTGSRSGRSSLMSSSTLERLLGSGGGVVGGVDARDDLMMDVGGASRTGSVGMIGQDTLERMLEGKEDDEPAPPPPRIASTAYARAAAERSGAA